MNKDEHKRSAKAARLHQRERMRLWARAYDGPEYADQVLAEFDKRFPAPVEPVAEVAPQTPAEDYVNRSYSRGYRDGAESVMQGMPTIAELAALREKARYWDAMWPVWYGQEDDAIHAARKVVDAGALK